jgi:hypothetical protein
MLRALRNRGKEQDHVEDDHACRVRRHAAGSTGRCLRTKRRWWWRCRRWWCRRSRWRRRGRSNGRAQLRDGWWCHERRLDGQQHERFEPVICHAADNQFRYAAVNPVRQQRQQHQLAWHRFGVVLCVAADDQFDDSAFAVGCERYKWFGERIRTQQQQHNKALNPIPSPPRGAERVRVRWGWVQLSSRRTNLKNRLGLPSAVLS